MRYEELSKTDPYAYDLLHAAFEDASLNLEMGTKVVPTEWGIQNSVAKRGDEGKIVSDPLVAKRFKILVKGRKTPRTYWAGFWRKK